MGIARHVAPAAFCGAVGIALAQTTGETGERGSIPPGESRDESRPAEGAIKGGSIGPDISTSPAPERDVARCKQLRGELREQCVRDLGAAAGGSAPPAPVRRDPVTEPLPPPQNPRAPQ